MPRLIEVAICVFAQFVCLVGILIGLGFVAPLLKYASSAIQGEPWDGGELARLIALVCGPVLVGLLSFVGLVWHLWSSQVTRQRMRQYPDQPWMWQSDWAEKSIHLSNHKALWVTCDSRLFVSGSCRMFPPDLLSAALGESPLESLRHPIGDAPRRDWRTIRRSGHDSGIDPRRHRHADRTPM
ncbi:MAG: hypothetical protein NT069_21605 [Planctomycetota bacterium]|nr:hypothetical protein [Planctomycetota bacterium]